MIIKTSLEHVYLIRRLRHRPLSDLWHNFNCQNDLQEPRMQT